jgi:hypothetical protein
MTDSPRPTPEQEAVRRLLAESRHDGPTPPEVVARLDEALASLVAERGTDPLVSDEAAPAPAPATDLGARRRRLAGVGLLAAASVVVAGVALGQALPRSGDDTAGGGDAATADRGTSLAESAQPDAEDDSSAGSAETAPESLKSTMVAPDAGLPTLSSTDPTLDQQVADLREDVARYQLGSTDALGRCELPATGSVRRLAAQVDGQAGALVFQRPDGAAQRVAVYVCGVPEPVRTLTLPAP